MKDKVLITSALLYANGPLHFGHIAGAYLPADCYARFERLCGKDVLYISGSDEYGMAITLSAEQANRSPQDHVDFYHKINKDLFSQLDFSFDHYSRTTWNGHKPLVQQFFTELLENGYLKEEETWQLYCPQENRFFADRYVQGKCPKCHFDQARGDECQKCGAVYEATDLIDPCSKLSQKPLEKKKTKHWFLQLEMFKKRLVTWIESKNWKPNVVNFIKNYIEDLCSRAITRDSQWGVPIPLQNTEGKVLYVWFDAPIGYITATMQWAQENQQEARWRDYWLDKKTKLVHFIGKDNIAFHSVIFPAMIMGQNQPFKLVDELPANEFLNLEGRQFSKSDGWFIDLETFLKQFTADQIRYTLAANAPETSDSEFTWKDFQMRCNSELVGKLGNFIHRGLIFIERHFQGKVPCKQKLDSVDEKFIENAHRIMDQIHDAYRHFKLRRVTAYLMELSQLGNVYFDTKRPWEALKDGSKLDEAKNTLSCCFDCVRLLCLGAFPIIPGAGQKLWKMLGYKDKMTSSLWKGIISMQTQKDHAIAKVGVLFQKVEDDVIDKEIEKLYASPAYQEQLKKQKKTTSFPGIKQEISIDDISKLDLRVGEVVHAESIAKSKKLLKLRVDIGCELRTIVAGLGKSYSPESLMHKKVIVITNLKPANLMGISSQGMLLAASHEDSLELLSINDLPKGSLIS